MNQYEADLSKSYVGKPFTGTLDGKNYTISGLYINHETENGVGLFGVLDGPEAGVKDLNLQVYQVRGRNLVGGLVGYLKVDKNIRNVKVTTTPNTPFGFSVYGRQSYVGEVVGYASFHTAGHGILSYLAAEVQVHGCRHTGGVVGYSHLNLQYIRSKKEVFGEDNSGGLIGTLNNATLVYSYALASIEGEKNVGGLVGSLLGESVKISNAYLDCISCDANYEIVGKDMVGGGWWVISKSPKTNF